MMDNQKTTPAIDAIARTCIAVRLRLLNRVVTNLYDDALRPLGLKVSQLNLLVVTAKLGVLYRPAYFNNSGYAIHGEPEVPSFPASHGCVRITVPAMDRFYSKLVVGTSVWIYRS